MASDGAERQQRSASDELVQQAASVPAVGDGPRIGDGRYVDAGKLMFQHGETVRRRGHCEHWFV